MSGLALLIRIITATIGAYCVALLVAILVSRLLPMDLGPATMTGMLISYWVFAAFALWVFVCQRIGTPIAGFLLIVGISVLGILATGGSAA